MKKFKIEIYQKENGEKPIIDFLNSLECKIRAKVEQLIKLLEERGNELKEPYSKSLKDGIFELRYQNKRQSARILYFFYYEGKIILTNGFVKKTRKTPKDEIKRAERYRKDFIERNKNES
jgi:phage-related protein